jgi:hypothetical protein
MRNVASQARYGIGSLLGAIGAIGGLVSKSVLALDRLTDAGYAHSDAYATNTELRCAGRIEDCLLEEEERNLERKIERRKFEQQLEQFLQNN